MRAVKPNKQKKRQIQKQQAKDDLIFQYQNGMITQFEFVKKISFKMLPPKI